REKLQPFEISRAWHTSVETLPRGPMIVIANEFVDALPIDQIVKTKGGWHERRIGIANGELSFGLDPAPLQQLTTALPSRLHDAPEGSIFERRDLTPMLEIAARIAKHGGAALIIDYGHSHSACGDTLQALRAHRSADPLETPGEIDLTAHVDFEQLAVSVQKYEARTFGPVSQG